MRNNNPHSFAGLPVTLVSDLLAKSGQIANEIYEAFHEIRNTRDKLREQIHEYTGIQNDLETEGKGTLTTCGIDGYFSVEKFLTTNIACCAACAVEGLTPSSGKKHWEDTSHSEFFHTEEHLTGTAEILRAVMMEMEIELASNAPHDIVFLNGSLTAPLLLIMETLKPALESKDYVTCREFLNRFKTSILALQSVCDSSDTKKMLAGISQKSGNTELVSRLHLPHHYDDTVLFTIILSPGEFTKPVKMDHSGLSKVKEIPIKDEKFTAVRDRLVSAMSELDFIYYRPYKWTPAYRIEIDHSIAVDLSQFGVLLNSFKFQCSTAGIIEPYPLFCAGKIVRSLKRALPSFRNSALSYITNTHKDDVGELFSLLLFQESDMGDTDG